jgi:hypothetical protein
VDSDKVRNIYWGRRPIWELGTYCDGVDVTTGHHQLWAIGMVANEDQFGCPLVLQGCCSYVIAGGLPMLLGAKQDQDVYLVGPLLPSLLSYTSENRDTCDCCVQNRDLVQICCR